jgi:hypothetical protein
MKEREREKKEIKIKKLYSSSFWNTTKGMKSYDPLSCNIEKETSLLVLLYYNALLKRHMQTESVFGFRSRS